MEPKAETHKNGHDYQIIARCAEKAFERQGLNGLEDRILTWAHALFQEAFAQAADSATSAWLQPRTRALVSNWN